MLRNNWTLDEINDLLASPVMDLLFRAQSEHRQHFDANQVQMSQLLSIKTGACPEDCSYCPQSGHYNTDLEKERLLDVSKVVEAAKAAKAGGASRFCMGGAWRSPPAKAMPKIAEMIREVKALGMETCMTLGMLNDDQAADLKEAGLDYYNHNIDTSPEYYEKIIKTRTFQDRLDTLERVRQNDINVCCGGILGLGESREDRASFLQQLANMPQHPQSVTINRLIAIKGTPLEGQQELDSFEFIRTIASARIMMPKSMIRLSAGRENMSDELQTLCFLAGANSIFMGDVLLTAKNPGNDRDSTLMTKLGLTAMPAEAHAC